MRIFGPCRSPALPFRTSRRFSLLIAGSTGTTTPTTELCWPPFWSPSAEHSGLAVAIAALVRFPILIKRGVPHRRAFSLRALFIVVTVVGCWLGWNARQVSTACPGARVRVFPSVRRTGGPSLSSPFESETIGGGARVVAVDSLRCVHEANADQALFPRRCAGLSGPAQGASEAEVGTRTRHGPARLLRTKDRWQHQPRGSVGYVSHERSRRCPHPAH